MVGALFIWVADWQGRRLPIFIGCLGVCVGTIVTSTAPTLASFVGGRFLLSFFSTLASTASPLYLIEIAPPQYRGTVAGMYNTLYYLVSNVNTESSWLLIRIKGSIIATSVVYGANLHLANHGELNWRLPLWLQMLCPGFVALGIWFCPESPRW